MLSTYKKKQEEKKKINFEEPECLIIEDTNGEDIILMPIGELEGSILYIERRTNQLDTADSSQEQEQHIGA